MRLGILIGCHETQTKLITLQTYALSHMHGFPGSNVLQLLCAVAMWMQTACAKFLHQLKMQNVCNLIFLPFLLAARVHAHRRVRYTSTC